MTVCLFLSVVICFSVSGIVAEASELQTSEPQTSEPQTIVVTGSRSASPLSQLANNNQQLNQQQIDFINATHISEALSRISGVWISRGNGQEHLTAIRSAVFTGPGSCGEFLMLQDGISVRASGFCNANQLFDVNSEQASSIEVVKGSNSALYGSNAMHGIVNVINALPQDDYFKLSLLGGSHGYSRIKASYSQLNQNQLNQSLSDDDKPSGLLVNFNTTHDDGFKQSSGFDQQKFHLAHVANTQRLNITSRISGSILNQQTAGYIQQGENAYRQDRFLTTNEFPQAFRDAWSLRLQTKIAAKNHNKNVANQWQLTPYMRSNQMRFLMHFLPGEPIEKNGHDSIGVQFSRQYQADSWQFNWGIDNEFTKAFLQQFQPNPTDSGSNFLNETLPQGAHYDYQVSALSSGVFAQWKQFLSQRWTVTLAGRFDYLKYDYDNHLSDGNLRDDGSACGFSGCRYSRPADRSDEFANFSWSIAGGYQISNNQFSYLKIDRTFRAPQATELYRLQNGQTSTDINQTLAEAIELGFRSHYKYQQYPGQLALNLYQINKNDVIFQNSNRQIVSGAKTRHQGFEIAWEQQLQQFFLGVSASYARHIYKNSVDLSATNQANIKNNQIDTAPQLIANLRLGWYYEAQSKLELSWNFLDDYYLNPENTHSYPGHYLVDLRLQHQLRENWQFYARISNLTDERYADRADFAFDNYRYFVGEPRSYFVGVSRVWN